MGLIKLVIFMLSVLHWTATCEPKTATKDVLYTRTLIKKYEGDVNSSRILQKDDKKLMTSWSDEFQIRRLDVTIKYRLQMIKHQEHSFRSDRNAMWANCLYHHRKDIRRSNLVYHDQEHVCLRTTTSKDAEHIEDVEQIEKQITKWRKGYRYLLNRCQGENPTNQVMAEHCLVEYMKSDRYDEVVHRLTLLKQTSMNDLYSYYSASLIELEDCLNVRLSSYLDRVRAIMDVLKKCYSIM